MSKENSIKEYKVLKPIGWNGRRERGEIIRLSDEEASAYAPDMITLNKPEPVEETVSPEDVPVEELKKAQLEELATKMGLDASGSKADLIERINLAKDSGNTE